MCNYPFYRFKTWHDWVSACDPVYPVLLNFDICMHIFYFIRECLLHKCVIDLALGNLCLLVNKTLSVCIYRNIGIFNFVTKPAHKI